MITRKRLQYLAGYLAGTLSRVRARCNAQYLAGYISGIINRFNPNRKETR
jgi:hypothetical protein